MRFQFTHPGGVRRYGQSNGQRSSCFNSRTREGCDGAGDWLSDFVIMFQFTHPGGVRREARALLLPFLKFQFTHPGGVRRDVYPHALPLTLVSIHAPGRGATQVDSPSNSTETCFNSRTREGCDWLQGLGGGERDVSIHAPGRGATYAELLKNLSQIGFNSRTREGCD